MMFEGLTVRELKRLLEDANDDAAVIILTDDRHPWECEIQGVVERSTVLMNRRSEVDEDGDPVEEYSNPKEHESAEDVLIVVGRQIAYSTLSQDEVLEVVL